MSHNKKEPTPHADPFEASFAAMVTQAQSKSPPPALLEEWAEGRFATASQTSRQSSQEAMPQRTLEGALSAHRFGYMPVFSVIAALVAILGAVAWWAYQPLPLPGRHAYRTQGRHLGRSQPQSIPPQRAQSARIPPMKAPTTRPVSRRSSAVNTRRPVTKRHYLALAHAMRADIQACLQADKRDVFVRPSLSRQRALQTFLLQGQVIKLSIAPILLQAASTKRCIRHRLGLRLASRPARRPRGLFSFVVEVGDNQPAVYFIDTELAFPRRVEGLLKQCLLQAASTIKDLFQPYTMRASMVLPMHGGYALLFSPSQTLVHMQGGHSIEGCIQDGFQRLKFARTPFFYREIGSLTHAHRLLRWRVKISMGGVYIAMDKSITSREPIKKDR